RDGLARPAPLARAAGGGDRRRARRPRRGAAARAVRSGARPPALRDRAHRRRDRGDLSDDTSRAAPRAAGRRMRWKRPIDVVGALVLLVVTSPVLVIAALAIRASMGAPVLYR